ncbi:MAG: hypothetical protein ACT6SF_13270 [Hydrogenophaga sp.]|uniref:hypothetical protein n=1 Tax=Hydrogenophaga sp. TaxID=1904254 RepID=UPI0040365126
MNRTAHIAGAAALSLLAACSGPSSAEIEKYSEACVDFYKEKRAKFTDQVEYRKYWKKEGKIVVSLAVKDSKWSSSYTEGLCVVDLEEGTLQIPALFDRARWSK